MDIDDIFAANGRSGFDVYAQDPALGAPEWRWAATETSSCTRQKGSIVLPVPPGEVCVRKRVFLFAHINVQK